MRKLIEYTDYFRYYGESSEYAGTMASTISYYTTLDGNAGVTYDYDEVVYTGTSKPSVETPQNPTVTIKYLYEDESEAASEYKKTLNPGVYRSRNPGRYISHKELLANDKKGFFLVLFSYRKVDRHSHIE